MSRRIVLSNAARTATVSCPLVRNTQHRYLRAYLDVQGASGTGGLTLVVRGYSWNGVTATNGEAMGDPATLLTAPAAITGTGVFVYELGPYPQAAAGNVQLTVARILPTYWDIQVQAGDGSSYTYSVSVDLD
jgi:hypothetical protein